MDLTEFDSAEAVEELSSKRKHLADLEVFIASSVHTNYVVGRRHERALLERVIVDLDPVDRKTEIESYKLRGELRCVETSVTLFEDARDTLKKRVEELESDIELAKTNKNED